MITEAYSCIGKAYAEELAKQGFKIGLIGKNREKLEALSKELKEKYKVETQIVVFNFRVDYTEQRITELEQALSVFDKVSILINHFSA